MNLPEFLNELLRERNLTRYALAKRMGRGHSTLGGWFTGTRTPGIRHLDALADALDVPTTDRERLYRLHREAQARTST